MERREFVAALMATTSLTGCTSDSGNGGAGNNSNPGGNGDSEPYELPEGVSEDGITNFETLFDSTVQGCIENSTRMDSEYRQDGSEPRVTVMKVNADTMFMEFDGPRQAGEFYIDATGELVAYAMEESDNGVEYGDLSGRLPDEDIIETAFSDELYGELVSVQDFNYELVEETTHEGRSAGLFESASAESSVVIDDTGWILSHSYETENSDGTIEQSELEFSGIGETEVREPDWLDEAKANT